MDWIVREAHETDAERLALIGSAIFLETFAGILDGAAIVAHCGTAHDAATYRASLRDGAAAWLGETAEGRSPIGYALAAPAALPGAQAGDLELKRIYLLSRFHGGGLGAELMRRAVGWAMRRGARRLLLGVYAGNARAIAFYRKQGFEPIADRRFRVGDRDYDDVVLARPLS
ncbi:MAG TPA: GNAT family N-acetyltransferase [Sphingomonas sp.]|nr:GNAT family N-acetyltransferase [Sphingomonas sp.]